MFKIYGFFLILALAVIAMGIKALTPAGIQLTETTRLSRKASVGLGIVAILFGIAVAVTAFVVIILPRLVRF